MDEKSGEEYRKHAGRRSSLYANLQLPTKPSRPHLPEANGDVDRVRDVTDSEYFPSDVVQTVLNSVKDKGHRSHHIFCELDTLKKYNDNWEWRETARWVKFEEVVEEGGKRWSKPHVGSLSMHALLETRKHLMEGLLLLDLDVHSMSELSDVLLNKWIENGMLDVKMRQRMRDITLRKHKHSHVKRPKTEKDGRGRRGSGEDLIPQVSSVTSMTSMTSQPSNTSLEEQDYKPNQAFFKKIPKDSEACNLMIGEVEDLEEPIMAFIRLKEPRHMEGITEVKLPTKFLVFIFGPKGGPNYYEIGRCVATMMIDEVFREVAYKAMDLQAIIAGLDEFVEQVTVLPPAEWDPKIRIEPPQKVQSQMHRKMSMAQLADLPVEEDEGHADPQLVMSKIPFSGLFYDIKRKIPWYWTDYKDALHIQCLAAFVYVFLGTFTPNVTFGGLLGQATDQYMGVMECIFAAAVTGILFALFSGQPLNILGSTGPMLVLESIIYQLCKDNDWDFLPARVWIGLWTSGLILLIVVFNLSALVKYITRFTEESFATLIAVIFIVEAFRKVIEIEDEAPINFHPEDPIPTNCSCLPPLCNFTSTNLTTTTMTTTTVLATTTAGLNNSLVEVCSNISSLNYTIDWPSISANECLSWQGTPEGDGCFPPYYVSDVFFLSILLFLGTFFVAVALKDFRQTTIFPSFSRTLISDFAVLLSIIIFVVIDVLLGLPTPKLTVPSEFKPTRDDRGWLISPISDKNPWWIALAAAVPAVLSVILIFLDQQITAVIVNRKENKLKKGVGYHLDMFVVSITVAIHSFLGLPWYVAATVSALAHINSLKKESECTAPGEKPSFLGVREQRVTALAIGVLSGAAVFITNALKVIPMPVLYGVFLYMGYSAMRGMQFVDRLYLFVQPVKYQPDLPYLRHVQLYRVHIFTIVQILCLGFLWAVKSIKVISIGFPLLVLATGLVRKMMECAYSQYELKWLDDLLPGKTAVKPSGEGKFGKVNAAFEGPAGFNKGSTVLNGDGKKAHFFMADEQDNIHYRDTKKPDKSSTNL